MEDTEVTPGGQALHAICKAEFKPLSAAGLRSKCSLAHGNKNHKKRGIKSFPSRRVHPGTLHPSAGPQEVGATGNAFVGICFPANEKELMLSPRNPGGERNGYHFTFALFALIQGRVVGRRETDFCPLYFLQK